MDRAKIIEALGLIEGGGFSITDMQMVQWGRDLIFECEYLTASMTTGADDAVDFRLIFHDCRDIKYRVYAHIGAHETGHVADVADVVEISLGQGHHRKDANILTNCFSINIAYGEVFVEKDARRYPIAT